MIENVHYIFWLLIIPGFIFMALVFYLFIRGARHRDDYQNYPYALITEEYYRAHGMVGAENEWKPWDESLAGMPSDPIERIVYLGGVVERVNNGGVGQSIDWLSYVPDESPDPVSQYEYYTIWQWLQNQK